MHVVLPELDGRILAGAIGFKGEREADDALAFRGFFNRPEPDRVEQVAARIAAMVRLQQTPREERRIAILMPDYPGAAGRTGYAVGLDVPSSVIAMLHDLKKAGYAVDGIPQSPRELLDLIERGDDGLGVEEYRALASALAGGAMAVEAAWGSVKLRTLRCPPLSCRTSPRKGGDWQLAATLSRRRIGEADDRQSPPLGGDVRQDEGRDSSSIETSLPLPRRAFRQRHRRARA